MTCRTIAIANQKGGTAKTATALSLGVALARTGSRVLLVDADPQGDLTKSLGWRDPGSLKTTLATHLSAAIAGSDDDPAAGMLRHREGVDLMPSNIELAAMEMAVFMAMSRERMMGAWLAPIKADYDYVIVDCAPTSGAAFQVLEGTEVRVNQDFDQPLLYTIEKMREMLEPWNPEREYEEGLFRQPVPEFDHRAFREALVNAFGHRDYASLGRVRVLVDDEGLTISNPGGFVEGVTIDNLLTVEPHGRNECLMGALKRIGLAEKTGRGVDRIYEGSLYCGRPLPDYSASTSANVTVFIARSAPDKLFMRMINEERERTGRPLSLRSLLVLDALKRQRRLTLADLCSQIHATDSVTRSTVENLVEAGLVEGVGNASGRAYMLSGRVYSRSGKDADFVRQSDIDKIRYPELIMKLAHQQGGTIKRRDVEQLLHLQTKQAYRELSKLVDAGELVSVGRGPGAHYEVSR